MISCRLNRRDDLTLSPCLCDRLRGSALLLLASAEITPAQAKLTSRAVGTTGIQSGTVGRKAPSIAGERRFRRLQR